MFALFFALLSPFWRSLAGRQLARRARGPRVAATLLLIMFFAATPNGRGAEYCTPNFLVDCASAQLARDIGEAAEKFRRELAIEWLGQELPRWAEPCPIRVTAGHVGAGGSTSFRFDRGQVYGWRMNIQGPPERLLDSVLPHEVTHTLFASHFRQPLPRWADEGACTTVEAPAEQAKHARMLLEHLRTGRGIPFSSMFAMTDYPRDILPLYAQGHSLASFLIDRGGRRKFVVYLEDGLQSGWVEATQRHYGYAGLGPLQGEWLAWVKAGRPASAVPIAQQDTISREMMPAAAEYPSPRGTVRLVADRGETTPVQASYRIRCADADGKDSHGSGTAIGPRAVITCEHVVRDCPLQAEVTIRSEHGREWRAAVVVRDAAADVAILQTHPGQEDLEYVPLGEDPSGGQPVQIYGYAGPSAMLGMRAETLRETTRYAQGNGEPVLVTDGYVQPGWSGGGMFDGAGQLIGINWGGRPGADQLPSSSTRVSTARRLIEQWEAQYCTDGRCAPLLPRIFGPRPQPQRTQPLPLVPVRPQPTHQPANPPAIVTAPSQPPPQAQPPAACRCPAELATLRAEIKAELAALRAELLKAGASAAAATSKIEIDNALIAALADKLAADPRMQRPKGHTGTSEPGTAARDPAYFEITPRTRK